MADRKAAPIGINDVGGLFTTDGKTIFRLVSINAINGSPAVQMVPLIEADDAGGYRLTELDKFMRLVPEIPPKRKYERHNKVAPEAPEG